MTDRQDEPRRLRSNVGRRQIDAMAHALPALWPEAQPELERRLAAYHDRIAHVETTIETLAAGVDRLVEIGEKLEAARESHNTTRRDVAVLKDRVGWLVAALGVVATIILAWLMTSKFNTLEQQIIAQIAAPSRDGRLLAIIATLPDVPRNPGDGKPNVIKLRERLAPRVPGVTAAERDRACAIAPAACL